MKVCIGADHAGYEVHNAIVEHLKEKGIKVIDLGTHSKESVDYPDYAHKVGESVAGKEVDAGILVCSTGIGMSIAANKIPGVRAGLVHNEDSARLCKQHNNANVLCIGQKFVSPELAIKLVDIYLGTQFEGGRHEKRVEKIEEI